MLGRKQSVRNNEDWKNALEHIEETVSKKELDSLVKKTVKDIKEKCKGKKAAYAWSAGKDSLVLGEICEKAGIDQSVLVRCNLEYPAFIAWIEQNKPSNLEIINTGQDMEWLKKHPDMLFPDKSNKAAQWFHIVQHRGQARYYKEHQLEILLLGRRKADGNYVGKGNIYTNSAGITRYSPLAEWRHEDILAYIHYYDVKLPPIYDWEKGYLCGTQLIVNLANRGEIDMKQLTVQFIDEEAIFPCMEDMTKKWRRIFMMMGAKFEWYCVEVKHFNCFNELSNDETFICWDSTKQDVWVRQPPSFAIRNHKLLRPRIDAYQDFLPRTTVSGITMVGIRTAESVQRLQNIASMTKAGNKMTAKKQVFPIYDWTDNDVWLFLLRNHVDIPEIYLFLWQSGSSKRQMRVSQFFSVDTARSLVKMNEYYPDLMERIIRREPNAYLAALYWDSEMFGRSSRKRKEAEAGQEQKDYRQELIYLFNHMDVFFDTPHKRHVAERYRNFFMAVSAIATPTDYKHIYEGLTSGDPKMRAFRALYQRIYGRYINDAKKGEHHG